MTSRVRRRRIVVAIDGPAGAGKSTVSKRLAAELGYRLLDTGALYRSVALAARWRGVAWDDEAALAALALDLDVTFEMRDGVNRVFLEGRDVSGDIRTPEVSSGASQVSALPGVRAALLDLQRQLGQRGGVIAEGRDIGTVVFPDAPAKFFLTASEAARAERRFAELSQAGGGPDLAATRREIAERDARDSGRKVAPLAKAPDAVAVDSSGLGIDEVVALMKRVIRERERRAAR